MTDDVIKFDESEKQRIGSAIVAATTENPREVGQNIMELATSRASQAFMDNVVNQGQMLVQHLNGLYIAKEKVEREISLTQKRIQAIRDGEFTMSGDGRILYKDVLLQF